ncbi:MAG TPA: NAD(P)H-hydrate dehydratase [Methanocella sp.]|nr:NAD(P)H-hydrate dehydratase [Methanocella sp.]
MRDYITVDEMRALEANADYFGVGYGTLMENAGRNVAEAVLAHYDRMRVLVVCGKGNNGGDGFVAARYLALGGCPVSVILLGMASDVKAGPAVENLHKLRTTGVDVAEIEAPELLAEEPFKACDIIVDAIMGTGSAGRPHGLAGRAIDLINNSPAIRVSVDVPSGLDCFTGICDLCVKSDLVVTFHALKNGLDRYKTEVADIGIPKRASQFVGPGDLQNVKARGDFEHKGQSGRVLVVGGGPYTGAPALVAMAALRTSAGVVTVAAPYRAADIIASYSPNIITIPLTDRDKIVRADIALLRSEIIKNDVVVIGNGAGRNPETLEAISEIIGCCDRVVIDADALQSDMPLKGIITPHRGEFRRITGADVSDDGVVEAQRFSSSARLVTLLKGRISVITDGERVKLSGTGNRGMAVGGTGDVLAGIAGALYCVNPAFEAASAAAFVSGAAGDLAFLEKGYGLLATDVIHYIPYAMKEHRQRR